MTWGSRPTAEDKVAVTNRDKLMKVSYRNYRSTFLILWLLCNIGVGFVAVTISRNSQILYLLIIAAFLLLIILIKLLYSTLHICKVWKDKLYLRKYLKTKEGKPFQPTNLNDTDQNFPVYQNDEEMVDEAEYSSAGGYYSSKNMIDTLSDKIASKHKSRFYTVEEPERGTSSDLNNLSDLFIFRKCGHSDFSNQRRTQDR